jgi:hypothetical protein
MALELYFRALENHRRLEAGEPPIPLTPQEQAWQEATDNSPEMLAYWETLEQQREAQLLREERSY